MELTETVSYFKGVSYSIVITSENEVYDNPVFEVWNNKKVQPKHDSRLSSKAYILIVKRI